METGLSYFGKAKKFLRDTSIEIVIGGLMGLGLAGYLSHNAESNRDKLIPVAFSEISQIEDEAENKDVKLNSDTAYHAQLNDLVMKVFESWNDSWANGKNSKDAYYEFALILNNRMGGKTDFRHTLSSLIKTVPDYTDDVLKELSEFDEARNKMVTVNKHFSNSWTESHVDNYDMVWVTDYDSKGNPSGGHYDQVYDDTTHTYRYHKNDGDAASRTLDHVISDHGNLSKRIKIATASSVKDENLEAIKKSRKIERDQDSEDFDSLELANRWKTGSNMYKNRKFFASPFDDLRNDAELWRIAKNKSRNHRYNTYSHSDSGPKDYKVVENTLRHGRQFVNAIDEVMDGFRFTQKNVPEIDSKIFNFTDQMLKDESQRDPDFNPKDAAYGIRDLATEMYSRNFKGGFDVSGYRGGIVALFSILGLVAGAASGFGADQAGKKYNIWDLDKHKIRNWYKSR